LRHFRDFYSESFSRFLSFLTRFNHCWFPGAFLQKQASENLSRARLNLRLTGRPVTGLRRPFLRVPDGFSCCRRFRQKALTPFTFETPIHFLSDLRLFLSQSLDIRFQNLFKTLNPVPSPTFAPEVFPFGGL
jgi:hypothetical protein